MAQRIMKEQEFESDVFDRGTWQKVFQLLWEHKKSVIPLIFFNTILVVTDVIMPLLNRYALNTYVDDQTGADTLPVFILVYVGMILAQCLLVYLFFRLAARVESDFGKNLREKCFRKLQEQTFSYFDRTANGWLIQSVRIGGTSAPFTAPISEPCSKTSALMFSGVVKNFRNLTAASSTSGLPSTAGFMIFS